MSKRNTRKIVLAWIVEDFEVVSERRTDLGERPRLKTVFVPKTVMWLNYGTPQDLEKAVGYAKTQTDHKILVFDYPDSEKDHSERPRRTSSRSTRNRSRM